MTIGNGHNEINKLIADFMNIESIKVRKLWKWDSKHNGVMDFMYDCSWDWLMPVWYKLRDIVFDKEKFQIELEVNRKIIMRKICHGQLSDTYISIGETIEWINSLIPDDKIKLNK